MSCQRVLPDALDGDSVLAAHHLHLDPLPRQVADARRFVSAHAPPDLDEDAHAALMLLTSELVTNAVLHARTPIELGITVAEGSVLVTVHDLDLARPLQRDDGREGGWGLGLVAALAEASALEVHHDDGKTAWFRLSRGPQAAAGDASAARQEPS